MVNYDDTKFMFSIITLCVWLVRKVHGYPCIWVFLQIPYQSEDVFMLALDARIHQYTFIAKDYNMQQN